jgi:hypothetical protein
MTMTHKVLIMLGILVVSGIIATLTQSDKELRQQAFIEEYNKSLLPKQPSQNYVYDRSSGKIVPMTVLSPEDAKKDCKVCHPNI